MAAWRRLSPTEWAAVRRDYECTGKTLAEISADHHVCVSAMSKRSRREGWTPRNRPRGAAEQGTLADQVQQQLRQAIERELAAIDTILAELGAGEGPSPAAERTARTLASLTRTLKEVNRLHDAAANTGIAKAAADNDDDDMPRDIDEFRRELTRRIDAFVASRTDAGIRDAGDG